MGGPLDGIHWRDCAGWKAYGLELTTTSDEAAKLYDLCIGQLHSAYNISGPEDGIAANIKRLTTEYPDFVMGEALAVSIRLFSRAANGRNDPSLAVAASRLAELARDPATHLTQREMMHIQAIKLKCDGFLEEATEVYQKILRAHPLDALAQKMSMELCFTTGNAALMRDSVLRVKPAWTPDMPLYSYLDSTASLGFEECGQYSKAEECCTASLNLNAHDIWATHTMAHVYEMQGLHTEGTTFLESTLHNWEPCGQFSCHVIWHQALLHLEMDEPEAALQLYDTEIYRRANTTKSLLNLCDLVSLLKRIEFYGVSVGERWDDVYELCRPHVDDHVWSFNDTHMLFAFLNCKKGGQLVEKHMKSLMDYVEHGQGEEKVPTNVRLTETVGIPLSKAMVAYQERRFGEVVDLAYPVRGQMYQLGGSYAQRDVYEQMLISACIQSKSMDHNNLARALLNERQASKADSSVNDKIMANFLASHAS